MTRFTGYWPILAADNDLALLDDAEADLADELEARGLAPAGPAVWRFDGGQLHVEVPSVREYAAAGDMRPWTSREAWAAEMLDWRAA